MTTHKLSTKAGAYLRKLCLEIPNRRVGSQGNQEATGFFAGVMASFGFEVESPEFDCMDWTQEGAQLTVAGAAYEVQPSPYSLGCRARAPLVAASTLDELQQLQCGGKILLLSGDLTREHLMPKNFTFYNPEEHQHIIRLLEAKQPQAIIAATSRDPGMAGAMYPFPLIEDGDFDIPSVYMKDVNGDRLAVYTGKDVFLESRARRIPAKGCNVVARKGGDPNLRVVLFAHIDAKIGTPGAIDNASGIVTLLLLAELLQDYSGEMGIEIMALNGEDYYSVPGEMLFLSQNAGKFEQILLGVNLDGAGYHRGKTAFSLYNPPAEIAEVVRDVFAGYASMVEGEQWYQSDHSLFVMNGRPALAITSDAFMELSSEITHTPEDKPEIVAVEKLVDIALALRDMLQRLDGTRTNAENR
ncbi:MAG TPA: M28 family peptidase [Anaerolineales bacterium]